MLTLIEAIKTKNHGIYDAMCNLEREGAVKFGSKHVKYDEVIVVQELDNTCIQVSPHWFGTRKSVRNTVSVTKKDSFYVVEHWVVFEDNNYGFYLDEVIATTEAEAFSTIYSAFDKLDPKRVKAAHEEMMSKSAEK